MTHVPFLVSLMGPTVLQIAFYFLFMVVLGLLCWAEAFSGLGEWGLLLTWCMGFLSQCLLLLQSKGSRQADFRSLRCVGSVAVATGLAFLRHVESS